MQEHYYSNVQVFFQCHLVGTKMEVVTLPLSDCIHPPPQFPIPQLCQRAPPPISAISRQHLPPKWKSALHLLIQLKFYLKMWTEVPNDISKREQFNTWGEI